MIGSVLFFALQAAAPQQVAMTAATADVAPQAQAEEAAAEATAPAEAPRKKVCRTVVDNRTGVMGKRSKVCRFVDEAPAAR